MKKKMNGQTLIFKIFFVRVLLTPLICQFLRSLTFCLKSFAVDFVVQ